MLTLTGFANVATRYGVRQWGTVSLEQLLANPPQVLLSGRSALGAGSWADHVVSHPALARIATTMRRESFPDRLLYCGGPTLIETAAALAAARRDAGAPPS
jgi:iron complex transport system substrate-binding protein